MSDEWIWITRWEDFQHYRPERDRPPAWIKDYTKQLDDDRYLRLTDRQRALVRDLRDIFATTHGRLRHDRAMIARRRNSQTRDADLKALNDAGLIQFVSRTTLEQSLEQLYTSPRARVEVDKEGEEETPLGVSASSTRSYETDVPAPSPNGRAAVDTHEDINLEPRTAPRFDCPHCDQIFPTWGDRQIHVDLDHVTDKEHA